MKGVTTMYLVKERNIITIGVAGSERTVRLDLHTMQYISGQSGKPYVRQNDSLSARFGIYEGNVQAQFNEYWQRRQHSTVQEVGIDNALLAVLARKWYWGAGSLHAESVMALQKIISACQGWTITELVAADTILSETRRTRFANDNDFHQYIIRSNMNEVNSISEFIDNYRLRNWGEYFERMSREDKRLFKTIVDSTEFTKEQQEYLARKLSTEHFGNILSLRDVQSYFATAELLQVDWNQKNFIKSFLYNRYIEEIKNDELKAQRVKIQQADKFIFENDSYKIVMPQTAEELSAIGKTLNNCVGGYFSSIERGRLSIAYAVRKDGVTGENIACEIRNDYGKYEIVQYRGFNNQNGITFPRGQRFFDEYSEYLKTIK